MGDGTPGIAVGVSLSDAARVYGVHASAGGSPLGTRVDQKLRVRSICNRWRRWSR